MSVDLDIRIVARGFGPRRSHVERRLRAVLDDHGLADDVELDLLDHDTITFAQNGVSSGVEVMERLAEALRAIARYGLVIDFFWRANFNIEDDAPWIEHRYSDGAKLEVPTSARMATPSVAPKSARRGPPVHKNPANDPRRDWPGYRIINRFEEAYGPAETGPPANAPAIVALEKAIRARLPLDYRKFVEAWGHVRVGPLVVFGVDPMHSDDVRAASRRLVDEIREYCRRDPDRTSPDYRTNMYPILSCDGAHYVLDKRGDVCRYDIESDRLDYTYTSFEQLLDALIE